MLLIYTTLGWSKLKSKKSVVNDVELNLSIVVPFRDEEHSLPDFLESIRIQNYNKSAFELIMVDDHSSDQGSHIVKEFMASNEFNVKLLQLGEEEASKKTAIEKAVREATGQVIITTDADTNRKEDWLNSISKAFESDQIELVIAPVTLSGDTFVQKFQSLEFNALQYITMCFAAQKNSVLCNGANMAFRKRFFERAGGYESNEEISSGDDVFLMFQLKKENKKAITFTTEVGSIVSSPAIKGVLELMDQKIRWSSKSIHIKDSSFMLLSFLVATTNTWLICLLPLEFGNQTWPLLFLLFLSVKFIVDYTMIRRISPLYNERLNIGIYILSFILYPFYIVSVFALSIFRNPTWKGRKIRI